MGPGGPKAKLSEGTNQPRHVPAPCLPAQSTFLSPGIFSRDTSGEIAWDPQAETAASVRGWALECWGARGDEGLVRAPLCPVGLFLQGQEREAGVGRTSMWGRQPISRGCCFPRTTLGNSASQEVAVIY